jgi:transposase-like protein
LIDGGPWYKPALNRLKLEWEHVTFGLRNHNRTMVWYS